MSRLQEVRNRMQPILEKTLSDYLLNCEATGSRGCSAMTRYHFETGGKRLRGVIPSAVFECFKRDPKEILYFGAAVEMIHNATLVHDDLQDGDELRRGRPTVWKKYSVPQAINCGDA
ncbi:MAG TPA: polyprenyl synthetase family protein, partial [Oligoflexia bacterium]|nr:polyprenyl synthetase family protein [Oligoflexia bacterium]